MRSGGFGVFRRTLPLNVKARCSAIGDGSVNGRLSIVGVELK